MTEYEAHNIDEYTISIYCDPDPETPDHWDSGTMFRYGAIDAPGAVYLARYREWEEVDEEAAFCARDVATILPDEVNCKSIGADPAKVCEQEAVNYINALNGNVYGWEVKTPEGEYLESICGYLPDGLDTGPPSIMLEDARSEIQADQVRRRLEAEAVRYWQERDVETVGAA